MEEAGADKERNAGIGGAGRHTLVVVVVVEARWTCCRMRSRHYVSRGKCRQSAEALTGWSGRGQTTGLWLVGLCLALLAAAQ